MKLNTSKIPRACPDCGYRLSIIQHAGISHLHQWYAWCPVCQKEYGYYDTRKECLVDFDFYIKKIEDKQCKRKKTIEKKEKLAAKRNQLILDLREIRDEEKRLAFLNRNH